MSITFNFRGNSHVLGADYYPTIELDERYEYALGLIGLHTLHTISFPTYMQETASSITRTEVTATTSTKIK